MQKIKLSVVIPAHNESKNLQNGVLNQVYDYLKTVDYSYEVIIVDDGSTDKTAEIIKRLIKDKPNFKLLENEHGGKALTVISGLLAAKGEIALFTDMDQATPLNQVEKFFPKFEEGFNIVIGSRHGREGAPFLRQLMSSGFTLLRNIILGLPFSDTQCGFKAFDEKSRQVIFPKMQQLWKDRRAHGAAVNAGFDVETLFLSKKMGFKIAEADVIWHYVGSKKVNAVKDSIEAVKDMLRIRLRDLNGGYQ